VSQTVGPLKSARRRRSAFLNRLRASGYWVPALLTGYLALKGLHPDLPGLACPFRALTGIPCPTCYLTRSISASLVADFGESLALHALGPLAAAGLILWSLQAIRQRELWPRGISSPRLVAAAALLAGYWAFRIGMTYGAGINLFPAF